jgi:PIN domain nuclease of toxin-antitoxin system
LTPRLLLDTHVIVWWLASPERLSRGQTRVIGEAVRMREPVAVGTVTLLEIAVLFGEGRTRSEVSVGELFADIESNAAIRILPLTVEVAREVAALGNALRDPADRAIVATARVHRLRLITSDERIIESELVTVVH